MSAFGCRHLPREDPGRAPRELPSHLIEPLHPRHAPFDFEIRPVESKSDYERHRFSFVTYSDLQQDFKRVEGEYYQSRRLRGARGPLLVVAPILGGALDGYLACRVFSAWAGEEGMSAFYLFQDEFILEAERDGWSLELVLEESIRDNLQALDLLAARPEVEPTQLGSFGISMGAIKNVMLIGAEPRLRANVLCLAGADWAGIVEKSREPLVERYTRGRREMEGLSVEDIAAEFRRQLRSKPETFARAVANDRVMLFLGSLDDKVPYENGVQLRETLGRPETYVVPLGHYTGILAAPYAASRGFRYMKRRFQER